jgi:hypothetical protein
MANQNAGDYGNQQENVSHYGCSTPIPVEEQGQGLGFEAQ